MIEEATAREIILAATQPLPPVSLPLSAAMDHYAAETTLAQLALPPEDVSAMDGYALHLADCGEGGLHKRIVVGAEQPAGRAKPGLEVAPGQCVRVFTGAVLPLHTAAVVMQEDTVVSSEADSGSNSISLQESSAPGEFVRRAGADLCCGQQLTAPGEILHAGRLSLLASQGMGRISAHPWPKVGILTTGSELRASSVPPAELARGEIYNSNQSLLTAQLQSEFPGIQPELANVADDLASTKAALQQLAASCQAVLIVGGVSVGDYDFVRPALEALGAEQTFWKVNIKPGKPFLFGKLGTTAVFGLPGNPVSAYVTCFAFALPALRRLAGCPTDQCFPTGTQVELAQEMENRDRRPTYFRGIYTPAAGKFTPQGLQESHALASLARANMLVRLPGQTKLPTGSKLLGWPLF